jgi:hypothetical protein
MSIDLTRCVGRGAAIILSAMLATACGSSSSGTDGGTSGECPTHANPTFKVGLSAEDGKFLSEIMDGQDVKMHYGSQGGCHLWLAFRTDGFVGKGATVSYTIIDLDKNNEQVSKNDVDTDFLPDPGAPGQCEAGAFKALMLQARTRENDHVNLSVTIKDKTGASASKMVSNLRATWPDVIAGQDRSQACGTM